ncbi:Uncharacterised protein [Klebsiella michiganensis]|uniref:Uncharacterized protein n=1 Tax=Klebsiella michiganensis TaxID=1134687 RepID=A0A7H4MZG6_9ENTR|nr:Uncharacterised protein [Klebsiella michiganensis]
MDQISIITVARGHPARVQGRAASALMAASGNSVLIYSLDPVSWAHTFRGIKRCMTFLDVIIKHIFLWPIFLMLPSYYNNDRCGSLKY